jgi:hypothetical protein
LRGDEFAIDHVGDPGHWGAVDGQPPERSPILVDVERQRDTDRRVIVAGLQDAEGALAISPLDRAGLGAEFVKSGMSPS